jgi:hypothetical protein
MEKFEPFVLKREIMSEVEKEESVAAPRVSERVQLVDFRGKIKDPSASNVVAHIRNLGDVVAWARFLMKKGRANFVFDVCQEAFAMHSIFFTAGSCAHYDLLQAMVATAKEISGTEKDTASKLAYFAMQQARRLGAEDLWVSAVGVLGSCDPAKAWKIIQRTIDSPRTPEPIRGAAKAYGGVVTDALEKVALKLNRA